MVRSHSRRKQRGGYGEREQEYAQHMCKCIKDIVAKGQPESIAIPICNCSVFHSKGVSGHGFECIPEPKLHASQTGEYLTPLSAHDTKCQHMFGSRMRERTRGRRRTRNTTKRAQRRNKY